MGYQTPYLNLLKLNLVKPITLIVNQMLTTGIFPDKLKITKIISLFKRGDKSIFSNYRPISLLPSIAKLFEKVIYQQIYKYFEDSNLWFSIWFSEGSFHGIGLSRASKMIVI